jgi:uncharacterized hydrophobic protein (TIGR00341 family)
MPIRWLPLPRKTKPSIGRSTILETARGQVAKMLGNQRDADVGGQECVRILTARMQRQAMVDQIQSVLSGCERWRMAILPVDGAMATPETDDDEEKAEQARSITATREELYNTVSGGAELDANYLLLVALSSVVAGIGLVNDSVAIVIGAMVIAPLLGPNLALALAAALGDRALMVKAAVTGVIGICLAILLSTAFSFLAPVTLESHELMLRTEVGYGAMALALASGAAAALSLTTGLSTTLVGVMVTVALLPPAVTAGLMLGDGRFDVAIGALSLLAVNIISVLLMAQLVFLVKGIRPHRWLQRKEARQSSTMMLAISGGLLALAAVIIAIRYG